MKRFKKLLLLGLVSALALTACSQSDPQEVEEAQDLKEENVEEEEPVEEEEVTEEETSNLMKTDGFYSVLLEESEEEKETDAEPAYEVYANKEHLVVRGLPIYAPKNEDDLETEDTVDIAEEEVIFEVNEDTIYNNLSGEGEGEELTMNDFNDYLHQTQDAGLKLLIDVTDGVVKEVRIFTK